MDLLSEKQSRYIKMKSEAHSKTEWKQPPIHVIFLKYRSLNIWPLDLPVSYTAFQ